MLRISSLLIAVGVICMLPVASAQAAAISLDFSTGADPNAGGSNTPDTMAPGTSAGAVYLSHWNNLYTLSGTQGSLMDSTGATTTASVTWNSNGTYQIGNPDNTGNYQMMNTEIDERSPWGTGPYTATVAVSSLPASISSGPYDVYVTTCTSITMR